MKHTCWAVATTETDINKVVANFVEVRFEKHPRMNIPYQSQRFYNFTCAIKWATEKKVTLRFGTQENHWDDKAKLFIYGEVKEISLPE